eukprot:365973-Chlamydomonas_euryale.AAC.7
MASRQACLSTFRRHCSDLWLRDQFSVARQLEEVPKIELLIPEKPPTNTHKHTHTHRAPLNAHAHAHTIFPLALYPRLPLCPSLSPCLDKPPNLATQTPTPHPQVLAGADGDAREALLAQRADRMDLGGGGDDEELQELVGVDPGRFDDAEEDGGDGGGVNGSRAGTANGVH